MLKSVVAFSILSLGTIGAAHAMTVPGPASLGGNAIVQVGEGCGGGMWRGPGGRCIPFNGPGGSYRGTTIECPPGYHIGPDRGRCWPNR